VENKYFSKFHCLIFNRETPGFFTGFSLEQAVLALFRLFLNPKTAFPQFRLHYFYGDCLINLFIIYFYFI